MTNQQYDQLDTVAAVMNWERETVYAFLYEDAVFDSSHQRVSDVGQWAKREPLQGKFITDDGDLAGNPAVFYMVLPDTLFQVVLAYEDGRHDPLVLGFYDRSHDGSLIKVQRRGSLFVRPFTDNGKEPPSYSIWLRPGLA